MGAIHRVVIDGCAVGTEAPSRHFTAIRGSDTPLGRLLGVHPLDMTETPESRSEATTVSGEPRAVEASPRYDNRYERPTRLGQILAWVGIIAGVVFIVAVIFFAGLFIGWSSGGHHGRHYGWHHGYYGSQMQPSGQMGSCSMMGPGGMMGPGSQPMPTTSAPSTPRP